MDTSWKDAITRYDADVASDVITFDASGYADSYPGKAETDAQLGAFIASHVSVMDAR